MPSIREVAKAARVSVTTVSRVLNNDPAVSEDTRRRVKRVIEQLGYRVNPSARALRTKRTGSIALIIPEIENPYFSILAAGVQDAASEHGFRVVLCNSKGRESLELEYIGMLISKQVDGFIITPPGLNQNPKSDLHLRQIAEKGLPFVSIGRRIDMSQGLFDIVTTDTSVGTQQALSHLIDNGHTRIAYFGAPENVAKTRLNTYLNVLRSRGLIVIEDLIFKTELTLESGYRLCKQVMQSENKTTAIFTVNDMVAIGALIALQELGVRVPEDVSVVGFDDIPLASIFRPNLTTVVQPKYDLGRLAVERLVGRLHGTITKFEVITLSTHLAMRQSTSRNK